MNYTMTLLDGMRYFFLAACAVGYLIAGGWFVETYAPKPEPWDDRFWRGFSYMTDFVLFFIWPLGLVLVLLVYLYYEIKYR